MEELIKKLLLEGKDDKEIAKELLASEDGKEKTAEEVAAKILEVKKLEDVEAALKKAADDKAATKKEKEADEAADKKVKERIKKALNEIKIDPASGFKTEDGVDMELKRYNHSTGKVETIEAPTLAYAKTNAMMYFNLTKQTVKAEGIADEIREHNFKIKQSRTDALNKALEAAGYKGDLKAATDPARSDSDASGGYAIATEIADFINQQVYEKSKILAVANTDVIIVEDKIYPTLAALTAVYIANQATDVTETQGTFTNPTIDMKRIGAFSNISNTIIKQRADIMGAFTIGYVSAFARFLDLHLVVGNVTNASDLQDGMVFDTNTVLDSAITIGNLTDGTLSDMLTSINDESDNLTWICNRLVADKIGRLENTGGQRLFPTYISGGTFSPFGIPLVIDPKIPSILDVGGDDRTGGTDNVLVLADMTQFIVGIDGDVRIETSKDYDFVGDNVTMRGIQRAGWKVLQGNTQASGGVVRAQELSA